MARPSPIYDNVMKAERGELTVGELKELLEYRKLLKELQRQGNTEGEAEHQPAGKAAKVADQTAELIKELRELIQILKVEKQAKKSGESK